MTNTTLRLIDRLSQLVDQNKYLILSGGIGVGKTYLACAVAENCALPQYDAQGSPPPGRGRYEVVSEMVPIHPSYSYENFVAGVAVSTRNGKAVFRCEDKIFLSMLHLAEQSWSRRCSATRFLIKRDKIFEKNLVPLGGVIGSKNATKSPLTCADRPPRGGAARVKERVF